MIESCTNKNCDFPRCGCRRMISKRRAALSYQYRKGLRLLLIERLATLGEQSGLSKAAVAHQIGLVGSQYSRVINGGGENITIDSLILFLERLGVRVALHFEELQPTQPKANC